MVTDNNTFANYRITYRPRSLLVESTPGPAARDHGGGELDDAPRVGEYWECVLGRVRGV